MDPITTGMTKTEWWTTIRRMQAGRVEATGIHVAMRRDSLVAARNFQQTGKKHVLQFTVCKFSQTRTPKLQEAPNEQEKMFYSSQCASFFICSLTVFYILTSSRSTKFAAWLWSWWPWAWNQLESTKVHDWAGEAHTQAHTQTGSFTDLEDLRMQKLFANEWKVLVHCEL